jgi:hypothetical protein
VAIIPCISFHAVIKKERVYFFDKAGISGGGNFEYSLYIKCSNWNSLPCRCINHPARITEDIQFTGFMEERFLENCFF